jgi:hypothetical protein
LWAHERELLTLTTNRRPAITGQRATASDQRTLSHIPHQRIADRDG